MSPKDLLLITIQAEASKKDSESNDISDFEDITHRGTTKRAKIEYGDFRQVTKSDLGDRDITDEISFLDVVATIVKRGDPVTYDSVEYSVVYFSLVKKGIYKIFATKKVRTGSKK